MSMDKNKKGGGCSSLKSFTIEGNLTGTRWTDNRKGAVKK